MLWCGSSARAGSTAPPLFDAEPALLRNFPFVPLAINASFNLNLRAGVEPTVRALVEDPQGSLSTVVGTNLGELLAGVTARTPAGESVDLGETLARGKIVLVYYRGGW